MLKAILQGKWLGHPLHPAIVHVPTGAWTGALIFDICSIAGFGGEAMVLTSFTCILVGIVAAAVAAPTGLADFWDIKPEKPARKIGWIHMSINVVVLVLFIVNAILRRDFRVATRVTSAQFALTIIGVILLAISGYLGGYMVYDHGIGVARMSKKRWRAIAERGNAHLPPAKEGS